MERLFGGIDVDSYQASAVFVDEFGAILKYLQIKAPKTTIWRNRILELSYNFEEGWGDLFDFQYEYYPYIVAIEEPIMVQNPKTTMMLSEIDALICRALDTREVLYLPVSNWDWKRGLYNKTEVSKTDTRNWVVERQPDVGITHTEHFYDASAIAIWCSRFGEEEYYKYINGEKNKKGKKKKRNLNGKQNKSC